MSVYLHKHDQPSIFTPENLLREARRQKRILPGKVPPVCVLDPDGDIAANALGAGQGKLDPHWACYHTRMVDVDCDGLSIGIVPCAVGAPFAVLVAEQLFASGCELLISMTSAGQITPMREPPYFVLIEQAFRDEGTSDHYLSPGDRACIDPALLLGLDGAFEDIEAPVFTGSAWTTDAPYRETESAIAHYNSLGAACVEMEAAALYAFAQARNRPVICFAHVTNTLAVNEGDFEKGVADGSRDALAVIAAAARTARNTAVGASHFSTP
jgi:uridine phosphorylase